MSDGPALESLFEVMATVAHGRPDARVVIAEGAREDEPNTKLARALNRLLDDLAFRTRMAERMAERANLLVEAAREFSSATQTPERLLELVAQWMADRVRDQCILRLLSDDGRQLVSVAIADRARERRAVRPSRSS